MTGGAVDAYHGAILLEASRTLGLMDREPLSPTRGCCDRTYWAWKFTDFPGSRFQEAVCVLGFLYATDFTGNQYRRNDNLLAWIGSGLRYWSALQHADGSFDEAYPNERSLAATAFTSFYVSEALGFLGDALPVADRERTIATLRRAGDWLSHNDEHHGFLSNHLAAAAAALYHIARLTGEPRFSRRSRYFLDRILARQSSEGWYDEYGGADPGYQTHGSFYLARVALLAGDEALLASLARANRFLAHFVHPDGSLAGEYASRGTQTYYPAAFEMLAGQDPAAAWIAETMRPSVASGAAAGLRGVDAWNYFPCLNNLVFASLHAQPRAASDPDDATGLAWFPLAGMARVRRARWEAFVGVAKGGAVKVFDRGTRRLLASDSGWVGKMDDGRTVSSHYLDPARRVEVTPDRIEASGTFQAVSRPVFTPWRFLAFRLFGLTAGRLPAASRWLKHLLVKVLITRRAPVRIDSHRRIDFGDAGVTITDEIRGEDGARLKVLYRASSFTSIHMGSARYFVPHELEPPPPGAEGSLAAAQVVAGVIVSCDVRAGGPA